MAPPNLLKRKVSELTQGLGDAIMPAAKKAATKSTGGNEKTNTSEKQRSFIREYLDGELNNILNTDMETEEAQNLACQIPKAFLRSHLPVINSDDGPDEWKFYAGDDDSPLVWLKTKDGRHPTAKRISAKTICTVQRLGLLREFQRKQEIELLPDFHERCARLLGAEGGSRSHFEMGLSMSTGGGAYSVSLSPNARGGKVNTGCKPDVELVEWLNLSTKIAHDSVKHGIPEGTLEMLKRHNIIDAAMGRGPVDSPQTVTAHQWNTSPIKDGNLKSLSKFGKPHVDEKDDPLSWNAYQCTSHLPPDHYPGNMLLPSIRVAFICAPGDVILFQGNMPHVSRGMGKYDVPEDSPLRYRPEYQPPRPNHERWRRMGTPSYTKVQMTRSRVLPKPEVLSKTAELVHWGSKETKRTWEMCLYIRENAHVDGPDSWKIINKPGEKGGKKVPKIFEDGVELKFVLPETFEVLDPKEIIKKFSWVDEETGETRFPSEETARICIEGQNAVDEAWEAAKKVTDACFFGFKVSKEVKKERARKQKPIKDQHAKDIAPYLAEFNAKVAEYQNYEEMGVVKPVAKHFHTDVKKTRHIGKNCLGRGELLNTKVESPELEKVKQYAAALGEEINRMEKKEREEQFLCPAPIDYDDAEYIDVEELTIDMSTLGVKSPGGEGSP